MALGARGAEAQARELHSMHVKERRQLDVIRRFWKGRQRLPAVIPTNAPREVRRMARMARVNVIEIVVASLAQSLFVDGFRVDKQAENAPGWEGAWQANRMDKHQSAIHRAAVAYGTAYAVVTPGRPTSVIRGVSPRNMMALYGEDPDWPMLALERLGRGLWRMYDEEVVYYLSGGADGKFEFVELREHGAPVTPVVRFEDEDDLDADDDVEPADRGRGVGSLDDGERFLEDEVPNRGQVVPLMRIQDQVDLTTFGLLTAQWYSAFRQRYILGWVAEDEKEKMRAGASQLWTFPDAADEEGNPIKIGEFGQTDLSGYIKSRDASTKHAATLSQTPVHELVGELVNLSAEALVAAEAGRDRKVDDRKTSFGESHEQIFWLDGQYTGNDVPDGAQVVWRDTSARAFAAIVDGLGKLATTLGIPPQELWERVPGATQQDVERWKNAAQTGDAFRQLQALLERQSNGDNQPVPPAGSPA
jgi:hypothetical protein